MVSLAQWRSMGHKQEVCGSILTLEDFWIINYLASDAAGPTGKAAYQAI